MGTMNFAFHKAARGVVGWKHPWEKPYVEGSEDRVFRNTFGDIRTILGELGDQHGARFEFECYDVGQLHNLAHCVEEGLVRGPLFIQCALGVLGDSGRSRKACSSCAAPPIACLAAATTSSRCLAPGAIR